MEIQLAELEDLQSIVEIVNEVTLHLHKKGINQWEYPCDLLEIREDIHNRVLYKVEYDNKLIGTFTVRNINNIGVYKLEESSKYLARIAISPEFQGKGIGALIIEFAISIARESGVSLYLDCWAGNLKLREIYAKHGFQHLGDYPENDYFISIFKYKDRGWLNGV